MIDINQKRKDKTASELKKLRLPKGVKIVSPKGKSGGDTLLISDTFTWSGSGYDVHYYASKPSADFNAVVEPYVGQEQTDLKIVVGDYTMEEGVVVEQGELQVVIYDDNSKEIIINLGTAPNDKTYLSNGWEEGSTGDTVEVKFYKKGEE